VCQLRNGRFRRRQAGFAMDIHNDGWGWAEGAPVSTLMGAVDNLNKYGKDLRDSVRSHVSRQLLLAFMVEMLPEEANRVSVDSAYRDALGNMKPVISYRIPDYSMNAMSYARQFSRMLFQRVGAEDHTKYDPLDPGYVTYEGEGFAVRGGNHLSGTHIMGTDKYNSVVDSYQKSWDHDNLYLTGAGSMPSIGTSNTTVTLAALCYRTSKAILKRLAQGSSYQSIQP
jgi:choline dehydrogenase-like flavoprotein